MKIFVTRVTWRVMDAIGAKFCRTCVGRLGRTSNGQFNSGEGILGDRDHVVDLGVDGGKF